MMTVAEEWCATYLDTLPGDVPRIGSAGERRVGLRTVADATTRSAASRAGQVA
jgi:hypothetical protein